MQTSPTVPSSTGAQPPAAPSPQPAPQSRGKKARKARIEDSARREAAAADAIRPPPSQAHAWDAFYTLNRDSFFKDRHLLRAALPELMPDAVRADPARHIPKLSFPAAGGDGNCGGDCGADDFAGLDTRPAELPGSGDAELVFVEAGCGVGNALFPVLRANPHAFAYAFDFSETAVALLRASEEYHPSRAHAFVADLARPETYLHVVTRPADYVVAVWALSALVPGTAMRAAVGGLAGLLRPGGMLLLRDYADGDMRMAAFARRDREKPDLPRVGEQQAERLFRRGDKTWAYFFRVEEVIGLMESAGLESLDCRVEERVAENRRTGEVMRRRWLVGRFRRRDASAVEGVTVERRDEHKADG
jgi:methyltransferase-like protein 6